MPSSAQSVFSEPELSAGVTFARTGVTGRAPTPGRFSRAFRRGPYRR
jgi:hypothetical protein